MRKVGDLLGSKIYNGGREHGFLYCVIAITAVYALILPLILLVPKELIANTDGEPNPKVEAGVLEEIAGMEPPQAPVSTLQSILTSDTDPHLRGISLFLRRRIMQSRWP